VDKRSKRLEQQDSLSPQHSVLECRTFSLFGLCSYSFMVGKSDHIIDLLEVICSQEISKTYSVNLAENG